MARAVNQGLRHGPGNVCLPRQAGERFIRSSQPLGRFPHQLLALALRSLSTAAPTSVTRHKSAGSPTTTSALPSFPTTKSSAQPSLTSSSGTWPKQSSIYRLKLTGTAARVSRSRTRGRRTCRRPTRPIRRRRPSPRPSDRLLRVGLLSIRRTGPFASVRLNHHPRRPSAPAFSNKTRSDRSSTRRSTGGRERARKRSSPRSTASSPNSFASRTLTATSST